MQSLYCTNNFFKLYRYYKLNNEIIKGMDSIATSITWVGAVNAL